MKGAASMRARSHCRPGGALVDQWSRHDATARAIRAIVPDGGIALEFGLSPQQRTPFLFCAPSTRSSPALGSTSAARTRRSLSCRHIVATNQVRARCLGEPGAHVTDAKACTLTNGASAVNRHALRERLFPRMRLTPRQQAPPCGPNRDPATSSASKLPLETTSSATRSRCTCSVSSST